MLSSTTLVPARPLRQLAAKGIAPVPPTASEAPREGGLGTLPNSSDFVTMLTAYHASGGMARGDNLGRLLDDWQCGDFVSPARLIAAGEIFSFKWHGENWVPMFQFDLRDLSVQPGPKQVLAELKPVFDDWTVAVWFVQPNSWLQEQRPLDLLDSDLPAVLQAARADRFIAAG